MIAIQVPEFGNTKRSYGREYSKLFTKYYETKADRVYYCYYEGHYEGSGHCIFIKDGKRGVHDMGHCSCYGPLDDMHTEYDTIQEALADSQFNEEQINFILKDYL